MESASIPAPAVPEPVVPVEDKGLKRSLGFFSTLVIGLNSTAPAYSLAAVLAGIVAAVGLQTPAALIVSFVPMFFIAASFYFMNRADPDCGTTFSWVTRALGPWSGWIAGWAVCMTGVLVIGSLADVAAIYTFSLVGWDTAAASIEAVTALAVLFIVATTTLCVIGTELSARFQVGLSVLQIAGLLLFAVVALVAALTGNVDTSPLTIGEAQAAPVQTDIELSWFLPWEVSSTTALVAALLIGVFIYWGWESALTLNEENEDATETPGRAGIASTVLLVITYVLVGTAVIAYAGPALFDVANEEGVESGVFDVLATPVLGSPLDKVVIISVLTSALASTQTTILPSSRTALSMAIHRAAPAKLGEVSPRYFTPVASTVLVGAIAIAWYVPLNLFAQNSLFDSLQALSLLIAFYYAANGLACIVYYRDEALRPGPVRLLIVVLLAAGGLLLTLGGLGQYYGTGATWGTITMIGAGVVVAGAIALLAAGTSLRAVLMLGFAPLLGAGLLFYVLIRSVVDLADAANSSSGDAWLGVTPALVMGVGFMLVGVVLMVLWRLVGHTPFFQRGRETVPASVLARTTAKAE